MRRAHAHWRKAALLPWLLVVSKFWTIEANEVEEPRLCPALEDENGRWEGSREVGGKYTLSCAPGFQVTRHHGLRSASLVCPTNFEWPEELECEDINNCGQLKHGCGAKGICVDLVDGYDCNCEKGYPRRTGKDGEKICGDKADEEICGGNTCGSYGLCIELKEGEEPKHSESGAREFRCECLDGFYDNGTTCLRNDCGKLQDKLGTWAGSTLFNEEYTLECPPHSFVWGYQGLRDLTIRCSARGRWLSHPVCHNPALEAHEARIEELRFWVSLGCVFICICSAALAAGLTLGLATLEPFGLTVTMATCEEHCIGKQSKEKLRRDQENARLILPLVRDHHRLLVTLMLFNTVANEALPIFLDELVPSWAAVLISVTAVLICGEILPSAIFTGPSQMRIAGTCVPLVQCLQCLFHYISTPIIAVLDRLIEQEDPEGSVKYSRAQLRALLQLHGQKSAEDEVHGGRTASMEEIIQAPGLCGSSSVFACLLGQKTSDSHGGGQDPGHEETHEAPPSILEASELWLINGVFDMQDIPLDEVPYTKRRQCGVADRHQTAAELLKFGLLGAGQRAVLVLENSEVGLEQVQAPPLLRSSTSSLRCPLVRAGELWGCVRLRDVVRGGGATTLGELTEPLVLIPDWVTALEALRFLSGSGSSVGAVIHGSEDSGTVQGIVSRSEILGLMLSKRARTSSARHGDQSGANEGEPIVPTPTRRHVGHRALFTRTSSTLEGSRDGSTVLRRSHSRSATASVEGIVRGVQPTASLSRRFSA